MSISQDTSLDTLYFPIPKTTQKFRDKYNLLVGKNYITEIELIINNQFNTNSQQTYAIVVHGKKSLTPGMLTPDGKLRVFALTQAFLNGLLPALAKEIIIIFSGQKGEAEALESWFRTQIADYSLDISNVKIFLDKKATNTNQNAINACKILLDPENKLDTPDKIFLCSTDWHLFRMWRNYELVRENSELKIYRQEIKGAELQPLFAPYTYRESGQPSEMVWRAEFHVYTHFLAPVVVLLYGLGEGKIKIVKEELSELFLDIYLIMCKMTTQLPSPPIPNPDLQDINQKILKAWESNLEIMDQLAINMGNWSGKTVDAIKQSKNYDKETGGREWKEYAILVNSAINKFRSISDPDRQ